MTDNILSRYGMGRDPYAWRSNMDAQPEAPPNILSQGPAPTGYDRVRDAIYNALGGQPQNAGAADKLATMFDLGTLGMATGAYDGGQAMAHTGDPGALAMALMPGGRPVGAAAKAAGKAAKDAAQGIRAYHGSPHDFDKFDMSRIGTGEGAQAYGHGLYFAESEGVAKSYRDALTGNHAGDQFIPAVDGKKMPDASPVLKSILTRYRTPEAFIDNMQTRLDSARNKVATASKVDELGIGVSEYDIAIGDMRQVEQQIAEAQGYVGRKLEMQPPGRMYEVNIKANPDDFLDWDKPLSQQSEKMRELVKGYDAKASPTKSEWLFEPEWASNPVEMKGRDAVREIGEDKIRTAGIPGIKYLDHGSRTAGEGSRNYVAFDDSIIEILRKYGLLPPAALGAAASQDPAQQ